MIGCEYCISSFVIARVDGQKNHGVIVQSTEYKVQRAMHHELCTLHHEPCTMHHVFV